MKVGFAGLGLMGRAMAERLLDRETSLLVYNRTQEKMLPLVERGAVRKESVRGLAAESDVVVTMLSDPPALEQVAREVRAGLRPGTLHIDCSTVAPDQTARLEQEYRSAGLLFMHAPVLGSVAQVQEGSLLLFAGGSDEAYRLAEPVLRRLGKRIWRFQQPSQATTLKLVCNTFIAGMILVLDQGLLLAKDHGLDERTLLDVIGQSAMAAPMYEAKGSSTIAGNFAPRFFVDHLLKDIRLARAAAATTGTPVPVADLAERVFVRAQEMGLGREDYSAVIKVLRTERGVA